MFTSAVGMLNRSPRASEEQRGPLQAALSLKMRLSTV
jgi:hypothetical protein